MAKVWVFVTMSRNYTLTFQEEVKDCVACQKFVELTGISMNFVMMHFAM